LARVAIGLAAISVDGVERSASLARQLALPFSLLADPDRAVITAYGLLNENEKSGIAYPATLVVNTDRTVRFVSLDRTVKRVDLDDLLAFLRSGSSESHEPVRAGIVPGARYWVNTLVNGVRFGIRAPRSNR